MRAGAGANFYAEPDQDSSKKPGSATLLVSIEDKFDAYQVNSYKQYIAQAA